MEKADAEGGNVRLLPKTAELQLYAIAFREPGGSAYSTRCSEPFCLARIPPMFKTLPVYSSAATILAPHSLLLRIIFLPANRALVILGTTRDVAAGAGLSRVFHSAWVVA